MGVQKPFQAPPGGSSFFICKRNQLRCLVFCYNISRPSCWGSDKDKLKHTEAVLGSLEKHHQPPEIAPKSVAQPKPNQTKPQPQQQEKNVIFLFKKEQSINIRTPTNSSVSSSDGGGLKTSYATTHKLAVGNGFVIKITFIVFSLGHVHPSKCGNLTIELYFELL